MDKYIQIYSIFCFIIPKHATFNYTFASPLEQQIRSVLRRYGFKSDS